MFTLMVYMVKSPGNPVLFNQSDNDFDTPEVFPDKCATIVQSSLPKKLLNHLFEDYNCTILNINIF